MKKLSIPNYKDILIKNVIFDINGTIQFYGNISEKIISRFHKLKHIYDIYLISADIRGNLKDIAKLLNVKYIKIDPKNHSEAEAKDNELQKLGTSKSIAIGNGNNDYLMLKNALIGICIIGNEGASRSSLLNSELFFNDPIDVLDFLMDEKAIIATLRS